MNSSIFNLIGIISPQGEKRKHKFLLSFFIKYTPLSWPYLPAFNLMSCHTSRWNDTVSELERWLHSLVHSRRKWQSLQDHEQNLHFVSLHKRWKNSPAFCPVLINVSSWCFPYLLRQQIIILQNNQGIIEESFFLPVLPFFRHWKKAYRDSLLMQMSLTIQYS